MLWIRRRLNSFWFTPTDGFDLAICRILFFGMMCAFYFRFDFGWYQNVPSEFYEPVGLLKYANFGLANPAVLLGLQWAWKLSLATAAIGLATRLSTIVSFALGIYLIGLTHSFGTISHYDAVHVLMLAIFAISRSGDVISVDNLIRRFRSGSPAQTPQKSPEYRWPIQLACALMALMYFCAGFSKLRVSGTHWFTSDYMCHLLVWHQYYGAPTNWGPELAKFPLLCKLLAFGSLVIELSVISALFSKRMRLLLIPAAYSLHVGIYLLIGPMFLQLAICYVFWVPWKSVLTAALQSVNRMQDDTDVLEPRPVVLGLRRSA